MASRGHRSFTAAFKLKVIQLAEEKGKHHDSQLLKVDRKRVREWCQKKALITDLAKSARRVSGAGRKLLLLNKQFKEVFVFKIRIWIYGTWIIIRFR